MRKSSLIVSLIFCFCTFLFSQNIDGEKVARVKVAYVYNFMKFTRWPSSSFAGEKAPFVVGIMAHQDVADLFSGTLKGKSIRERKVKVKTLVLPDMKKKGSDEIQRILKKKVSACHVMYIGEQFAHLIPFVGKLNGCSVLTVSDVEGFIDKGGIIGLDLEKKRIVFDVNLAEGKRSELLLSSRMLQLARIVKR